MCMFAWEKGIDNDRVIMGRKKKEHHASMHAQISIEDITDSVVWRNTRSFYKGLS